MLHENKTEDRALVISVDSREDRESDADAQELILLCESAGVVVADEMRVRRSHPDPRYYVGSGIAEDAFLRVQESDATVVVFGADLSPSQQRNLEDKTGVRVVDRTQLILDIFAQRARSNEGKLQVELAQLQYLLPRLSGKGIAMSRVGGAAGGGVATRGPGETKLETDRRRVRKRIDVLKDELEDVVKQRTVQNRARRKLLVASAALVGYTSAGKSTLLNRLSDSDVETDSRLFATLDPTTRRIEIPGKGSVIVSDTVGFIRNLPHGLVAAFRATLEEVTEADFLIHVVDASNPNHDRQMEAVNDVLSELGAGEKPVITVFNKADMASDQYALRSQVAATPVSCYISALSGDGMQYLDELILKMVSSLRQRVEVVLPYSRGDLLAMAHERGAILREEHLPEGTLIEAEVAPDLAARLQAASMP